MFNITTIILDFLVILLAVLAADGLILLFQNWKVRKLDINCDNCEEPKKLSQTPDKLFFLCQPCMEAYISEHGDNFGSKAIDKARKEFYKNKTNKEIKNDK